MLSKQEILKLKRFLEEFSWLMDTYSKIDLKKASLLIDESLGETSELRKAVGSYESKNPNIQFLTGVLPSLFLDDSLFRTNDDIAEFASTVLKLEIPRHHKKSKYEIIGHIVCETNKLNEKELGNLVGALSLLVNDEKGKEILAKKKKDDSFSWNEMIQTLTKD
ncbi:hypothetical protein CWO84_09935 [Methylomonas sp. Kb3]|uniref:hypothetical protein n=1 Tax=Methylomonas sp. Kb3 TaxID=1611544 RepID=UPI000C341F00|nr:hypothetical protein [Methylomonas sp. Kb3]PKD40452.1 hypothetical protein CWO84_09935 [Methylomonas sp. Kb3]